jgi:tellurite resistance protein TerC
MFAETKLLWKGAARQARRAIILVVGLTLLLAGVVMLVTPGPGWLLIFAGLSVLAIEFVWARRLLKKMKEKGGEVKRAIFPKQN